MREEKSLEGTLEYIRQCCIEELRVEKRPRAARKEGKQGASREAQRVRVAMR